MIDLGELGFRFESSQALGITSKCRREDFRRDFAIEFGVERATHLSHTALADQRLDLIAIVSELVA